MLSVVRSAGATVANRALQLVVQDARGLLADVGAAWYQIFNITTATLEQTPTQVFPTTVGNREPVDIVNHRLGVGRLAALWTPAGSAQVGKYMIRWCYRFGGSGNSEYTFDQEFELVPTPYPGPNYCTLYDLINAGLASASTYDGVAQRLIVQCSRFIEHYTGRQFSPSYKVLTASGSTARALLLEEPICALEGVGINYSGEFTVADREVGNFAVFNRHLRENLFRPDDRDNPKIEFLHGSDVLGGTFGAPYSYGIGAGYRNDYRFTAGVQNVQVAGVFGYTEPDGSMVGATPYLIRQACQLMCFKQQYALGSSARTDAFNANRLKSEYTRDQGFIYDSPDTGRAAPFLTHTMDPEIDAILYGFVRPPQFGAA